MTCRILAVLALVLACGTQAPAQGTTTTSQITSPPLEHAAAIPTLRAKGTQAYLKRHQSFIERGKAGPIGVLFLGDSITDRWTSAPAVWNKYFGKWHPANFGIGGDRTQHLLWRITNGELDGISPKAVVLLIGTNNSNSDPPEAIVKAITKIVGIFREKLPKTQVVLLGIFPRDRKSDAPENVPMQRIREANPQIAKLADGKTVHFLDFGERFLVDGKVSSELMPDGVHLSEKGYEIWGKEITPLLKSIMGE